MSMTTFKDNNNENDYTCMVRPTTAVVQEDNYNTHQNSNDGNYINMNTTNNDDTNNEDIYATDL